MAEVAAISATVPVVKKEAKEANRQLRRAWQKAKWDKLTEFELETVFWRVVWGEGLLLIGKIVLDVYQGLKVTAFKAAHPEMSWDDLLVQLPIGPYSGGVGWVLNAIPQWREWKAQQDVAEQALLEAEIDSDPLFQAGYYLDKYYMLVAVGLIFLFIFLEYQRVKKLKKYAKAGHV